MEGGERGGDGTTEEGAGRERGREGREREGSVPGSFSQILAPDSYLSYQLSYHSYVTINSIYYILLNLLPR